MDEKKSPRNKIVTFALDDFPKMGETLNAFDRRIGCSHSYICRMDAFWQSTSLGNREQRSICRTTTEEFYEEVSY
jgi:hypothetical protein